MPLPATLSALEAAGTAQNRKVYARHGIGSPMYGVSYAALRAMAKQVAPDQGLAEQLWESGNHDARVLATLVADPAACKRALLERWARDLDNYVLTDALSGLVARSPHAKALGDKWMKARGEWVGMAGWNVAASRAMAPDATDAEFEPLLATIEGEIHDRPNRVRHAMNNALIAIGGSRPALRARALAVAKAIGVVEVDHGETGCKTPEAAGYIRKMVARQKK